MYSKLIKEKNYGKISRIKQMSSSLEDKQDNNLKNLIYLHQSILGARQQCS